MVSELSRSRHCYSVVGVNEPLKLTKVLLHSNLYLKTAQFFFSFLFARIQVGIMSEPVNQKNEITTLQIQRKRLSCYFSSVFM